MTGALMTVGCVLVIAAGVAVILYTLLRTPKTPASIGDYPSIDLGEMPTESDEVGDTAEPEAAEESAETTEE